ncbi:MAG: 2-amino-4-hydroxy-6-hydroxymethyldihydropteridine diphosphokinase [Deltaproteobacteria bacterium]|nr:2-amino-4-hydroxy-6-hydroxymethyldihydropteridine diphosphokinase [Deltaproteobacteria bacterium]MBW2034940.1 2-amino-4-hydroxy-6-hydroxymethyldihydropteridine diphosphokinase [Deltaproteobacteria bacterium]
MKVNDPNMKTAYIAVGSNLGDKLNNCFKAIGLADKISGCSVEKKSGFYRTEPVGVEDQDWYVNAVISMRTGIQARDLLKGLLAIEAGMGRIRDKKWESRPIDLDILLFGQDVINEKDLTIPHPRMHLRRFVLVPMAELVPDLIHPVLNETMAELLDGISGEGQMVIPLVEV